MCLNTKLNEPLIAEEDIICYKFYVYYEHDKNLYSPYRDTKAPEIGITATTKLDKPTSLIFGTIFNRVERGFHSFANLGGVRTGVKDYNARNTIIIKCIIPKGSHYYKGEFMECESYCSNQIKLIEVCV